MWTKVNKEVLEKAQYIVPLKKGELQIEYAKALVKIDKAIEELKLGITFCENDSQGLHVICNMAINREKKILQILEDKEVE